jgi:hypothetical protein
MQRGSAAQGWGKGPAAKNARGFRHDCWQGCLAGKDSAHQMLQLGK